MKSGTTMTEATKPASQQLRLTREGAVELIVATRFFDLNDYSRNSGSNFTDLREAISHYIDAVDRKNPSIYFDENFYCNSTDTGSTPALIHYIIYGAQRGIKPSIHFDPQWYSLQYNVPIAKSLSDYLNNRRIRNPHAFFDVEGYLLNNPDLVAVSDPYRHFIVHGSREARPALTTFNVTWYRQFMGPAETLDPMSHFLLVGRSLSHPPLPTNRPMPTRAAFRAMSDNEQAELLAQWGVINVDYYTESYSDVLSGELSPAAHFWLYGDAEGRRPHPLFDPEWYKQSYLGEFAAQGALRHYLLEGEAAGYKPSPVFDTAWYSETYGIDPEQGMLFADYCRSARENTKSPNPYFDINYYLDRNPDIKTANIDAFEHWFRWGIFEGRTPSPRFDPIFVWRRYLGDDRRHHAFEIFMDLGQRFGWAGRADAASGALHAEVKANQAEGPLFEATPIPPTIRPAVKAVAFYLPQFHAIPENDAWWGTGFTEWRNISRGVPRYRGHYQPRVPRDLGFYSLDDAAVFLRQIELAKMAGLEGFCFYYYNFNGRRLLEKPLDAYVSDPRIDFPFCLLWANESWTRRWDGMEQDVLLKQEHSEHNEDALIDDIAAYLKRPNYIKVGGRPFFGIYRADIISDCATTLKRWRALFKKRHGLEPYFVMAQTFDCVDPREFGFDAALEFPPHKIGKTLRELNSELEIYDPAFTGSVRSYAEAVTLSLGETESAYPLFRTAFPQWDNDARKQGSGVIFHGATPALFEEWVRGLSAFAKANPVENEALIFVNAWNEWCEGAYLEPDVHHGFAFPNAMARALSSQGQAHSDLPERILLVGHDAFAAGSQLLLLNIGKTLKRGFGSQITFLLLGDGDLLPAYREVGDVILLPEGAGDPARLNAALADLKERGYSRALTNTTISGDSVPPLRAAGFRVVSLLHELPTIVHDHHAEPRLRAILEQSHAVVFPNTFVKGEVEAAFGSAKGDVIVQPQGLYRQLEPAPEAALAIRAKLGLRPADKLVLNAGHADLRKGVDIFVSVAEAVGRSRPDIHFLWVGSQHPSISAWIHRDIKHRKIRNVHFLPFEDEIAGHYSAADLFFLSSREDPFPSVVLEALSLGVPVAAFDWGGGFVELLSYPKLGTTMPYLNVESAAARIISLFDEPTALARDAAYRKEFIKERFRFPTYVARLAQFLNPERRTVSVVVPNFNYGSYLEARLRSIFDQTYPVHEIIVLDDASTDNSRTVLDEITAASGRIIDVVHNVQNSGNVFRQWEKGLSRAKGEFIWIAEADDLSEPGFLAAMMSSLRSDDAAILAFSDSRAIDATGAPVYASYKGYYASDGDNGMARSAAFSARDFLRRFLSSRNMILNASSVVWRTANLRKAFADLGEQAFTYQCAGDWRLYVQACSNSTGTVHYHAETLNVHRRHTQSVTAAIANVNHLREIRQVQMAALFNQPWDKALFEACDRTSTALAKTWGIDAIFSASNELKKLRRRKRRRCPQT
jgi:glycosyltransferase involved in cell wall biosynthesis